MKNNFYLHCQKSKPVKILIITASELEVKPLLKFWDFNKSKFPKLDLDFLITGIGIPNTIFHVTRYLENNSVDVILNVGICGSFNKRIKIGDIVQIIEEIFADIGYENNKDFVPFIGSELWSGNKFPFKNGSLFSDYQISSTAKYSKVIGITVNTVHGNENSIAKVQKLYNPDVETMEGAAVFFVALQYNIQVMQLRCVSNFVEIRNKDKWEIPRAIENVNKEVVKIINCLQNES